MSQSQAAPSTRNDGAPRTNAVLAVIVAGMLVAAVTIGYLTTWKNDASTVRIVPYVAVSKVPRVAVVTYEVTGKGRVDINYVAPQRMTQILLDDQPLPWRIDLPRQQVEFVSILASSESSDNKNPFTARVLIDGIEVCSDASEWGFQNVRCMELIPSA